MGHCCCASLISSLNCYPHFSYSFYPLFPVPLELAHEVNLDVTHSELLSLSPEADEDEDAGDEAALGDGPHESAPLYGVVAYPTGIVHFEDDELRHDVVRGGLARYMRLHCNMDADTTGLTRQFPAAKVIHAVHDHQATMNPKKRPYFGPALSALQT